MNLAWPDTFAARVRQEEDGSKAELFAPGAKTGFSALFLLQHNIVDDLYLTPQIVGLPSRTLRVDTVMSQCAYHPSRNSQVRQYSLKGAMFWSW